MKKVQALPITDTSWILWEWGNRVGLLTTNGVEWHLINDAGIHSHDQLDALQIKVSYEIEFQQQESDDTDTITLDIQGWPVKHAHVHDVELEPRISYAKTPKSKSRHAAGYWIIQFDTGWSGALCPKCNTLDQYVHEGPFVSKLEMNVMLNKKNRTK